MISSTPGAKVAKNSEERSAPSARVVREGRDVYDKMVVQMVSLAWIVAGCKTHFSTFWDVSGFEAIFSAGHIASMYDRKGVWRDKDISGWNRRWPSFLVWCPGYVDSREVMHMSLLLHEKEWSYLRGLSVLQHHFGEDACFDELDLCCQNLPFDRS